MGTEANEKNQSHGFLSLFFCPREAPGLAVGKLVSFLTSGVRKLKVYLVDGAQRMARGGVEHTATGEAICLRENTVLLYRCSPVLMIGVGKAGRTYTENGTGMCIYCCVASAREEENIYGHS